MNLDIYTKEFKYLYLIIPVTGIFHKLNALEWITSSDKYIETRMIHKEFRILVYGGGDVSK